MNRRHLRCAAVVVTFALSMSYAASASGASTPRSVAHETDKALAMALNIERSDLPGQILWNASSPSSPDQAEFSQGLKAVTCIRSAGGIDAKVGPDPFGTYGKPGGVVTADVTSCSYVPQGSTTGLPSIGTETVLVKTRAQAATDLSVFATKRALDCYGAALVGLASTSTGKATIRSMFLQRAPYGDGNRGVHAHYVLSGGLLSEAFYDDSYFYVEGRAEIILNFTNEGLPFTANLASSMIEKVMNRAEKLLG